MYKRELLNLGVREIIRGARSIRFIRVYLRFMKTNVKCYNERKIETQSLVFKIQIKINTNNLETVSNSWNSNTQLRREIYLAKSITILIRVEFLANTCWIWIPRLISQCFFVFGNFTPNAVNPWLPHIYGR